LGEKERLVVFSKKYVRGAETEFYMGIVPFSNVDILEYIYII
jgi:hypothetical protein